MRQCPRGGLPSCPGARAIAAALAAPVALAAAPDAAAHGVTELAQQRMLAGGYADVVAIGAEHMLTGYDHLLFLFAALLCLTRGSHVLGFVTAFTLGHTATLLFATLNGFTVSPVAVDAVIALTVVYAAFANLGGFERWLQRPPPNLYAMVLAFGLIHGLGLATSLQRIVVARDPELVGKILAFNVGVELGQLVALAGMGVALHVWRRSRLFPQFARLANVLLIAAGVLLFALQVRHYVAPGASA